MKVIQLTEDYIHPRNKHGMIDKHVKMRRTHQQNFNPSKYSCIYIVSVLGLDIYILMHACLKFSNLSKVVLITHYH